MEPESSIIPCWLLRWRICSSPHFSSSSGFFFLVLTAGPRGADLHLDGIGEAALCAGDKEVGRGNGQDGSCARDDKADVRAVDADALLVRARRGTSALRCGTRPLVKERRLGSSDSSRRLRHISVHVDQGVGCAREDAMFC